MRAALSLSLVLLGLTLLAEHGGWLVPHPPEPEPGADAALELLVTAKGPCLPPVVLGPREAFGEAMRIGDRTLVAAGRVGLRFARIAADHALVDQGVFDVAHAPEERTELVLRLEDARPGDVVLLASSGRIEPLEDRAGWDALAATLAELGAAARPGTATPESWALITRRGARGWEPLAEGYSRNSGIRLAQLFGGARDGPAPRPERVLVRASGPREVPLIDELAHASLCTPGITAVREATVLGRALPALRLPPVEGGAPARLVWDGVPIEEGAGLVVRLGMESGPVPLGQFEVLVDGERIVERPVQAGSGWRPLQTDLRAFAGRSVTLELRATGLAGAAVLVGLPMLVQGYERAPLEAWAESR